MKKIVAGLLALTFLVGPVTASAESANIQAILAQIKNLQLQLNTLRAAQVQVASSSANVSDTLDLIRTLKIGMTGDDVAALQVILAADPSIYPDGTVNGIFGTSTAQALKKFQRKHGIDSLGYAGPKTLKKLNKVLKELGLEQERSEDNKTNRFCLRLPLKAYVTPGWYKKNGEKRVKIEECRKKFNDYINNPGNGWISSTTPTLVNQVSSSVVVGGTIYDRVTISGGTNPTGNITFQVYGPWDSTCTTPISPAPTSATVTGNGMYNSGNVTATSTGTYRFIATYSGDSKNKTVSTKCTDAGASVVVTAVPDTTAPSISAVGTTNLLGTTTNVVWTTNENSNSKVWFGTSTPLTLTHPSVRLVSDASLVTNHVLSLTGLSTSTTYYFAVVSSDSTGNTATSTESSFITTAGL